LLNAGASALAQMAIRLFAANNITTTVLVRRDEQIPEIKKLGAKDVLNQNQSDEKLREVFEANKIQIFFDAVGGETAAKTLGLLPNGA
jgi:NADPH:quinone reductase-like Zn-dependent oxidoreductase